MYYNAPSNMIGCCRPALETAKCCADCMLNTSCSIMPYCTYGCADSPKLSSDANDRLCCSNYGCTAESIRFTTKLATCCLVTSRMKPTWLSIPVRVVIKPHVLLTSYHKHHGKFWRLLLLYLTGRVSVSLSCFSKPAVIMPFLTQKHC